MKIVRITESDFISLIRGAINEETKVVTDYDQYWDYKMDGDTFYAKKKNSSSWIKLHGKPLRAVQSKVFKIKSQSTTTTTNTTKPKVDPKGGEKLKKLVQVSPSISSDYKNQLKLNSLSSTKTVNRIIPKPNTTDCAQFVNNFNTKLGFIGDAWLAQDINSIGKRIFSIYDNVNNNQVKKYTELYRKGDKLKSDEVKQFQQELLSKKPTPPQLKLDDVVGIYNPGSLHTVEAFLKGGEKYFIEPKWYQVFSDAEPGKTLKSGKGFSFNTHVGIVGAIVDGVPVVFHNMLGDVRSEPANNLKITWVKRL